MSGGLTPFEAAVTGALSYEYPIVLVAHEPRRSMVDRDQLAELAVHYLAMLVLVFLVLAAVRSVAGEIGFWREFVFVVIVVALYRPLVTYLGVAPSMWER